MISAVLLNLSGFNRFIMRFCPTILNTVLCIGTLLMMHLVITFSTGLLAGYLVSGKWGILTWLTATIATTFMYYWIQTSTFFQHKFLKVWAFLLLCLGVIIITAIISFVLSLVIFEASIESQYFLYTKGIAIGSPADWTHKIDGLLDAWENSIVKYFSTAIYLFLLLLFLLPYLMIYQSRNSSYFIALQCYEKKKYKIPQKV